MRALSYKLFIETTVQIIDQRGRLGITGYIAMAKIYMQKGGEPERKDVVVRDVMKLLEQMTARQLMR